MVEKTEEKKRRKILVTGSSGMLGSALCKELSVDYEIVGLDIRRTRAVNTIQCDITNQKKTLDSIVNTEPDLVIHTAAWTDVDGCEKNPHEAHRINLNGTKNVVKASAELNIPLIYISTDFVFDGHKKTPYTEEDPPNPLNVYAESKLKGEKELSALDKYIILRTSWLFGTNGRNFVDTILDKAKKEKTLKVVDDQVGSPTYARDLAWAINKLLAALRWTVDGGGWTNEIYHVSNKGAVSWFDYAKRILELAGIVDVSLIPIKSNEFKSPAKRPSFSVLDNSKFEKAIHLVMRTWQEALQEYIICNRSAI